MDDEERPLTCLKRTTAEPCEVRRRLTEAEKLESEPIAIVGMGCRLPGGIASPEELWRVLEAGGDETSDFPVYRQWPVDLYDPEPGEPGKSYTHKGGFLHDAPGFDPTVPGIGSREAITMDTQLLLLNSWGRSNAQASFPPRSGAAVPESSSGSCTATTAPGRAVPPMRREATSAAAPPTVASRAICRTSSVCKAPRSQRAPPRWWPCTGPFSHCAGVSPPWRWPGARR